MPAHERRPLRFRIRPFSQTVESGKPTPDAILKNAPDDEMSRTVFAETLVIGDFDRVVPPAVGEGKVRGDDGIVQFQKIRGQVTKLLGIVDDGVIKAVKIRLARNGGAFLAFPSILFQAIEALKSLRIGSLGALQTEGTALAHLSPSLAQVVAKT